MGGTTSRLFEAGDVEVLVSRLTGVAVGHRCSSPASPAEMPGSGLERWFGCLWLQY